MKRYLEIRLPVDHPAAKLSRGFMLAAALIRLCYYLPREMTTGFCFVHVVLPVCAAAVFLAGMAAGERYDRWSAIASVVLGVVFFIWKAAAFAPMHRILCTILYLSVLCLFSLTVLGFLPTKKLLYPLFGLPLLYHIFVEDTKLYFFAEPPVPVWDWLPEVSVLCIMAALLSLSVSMEAKRI